MSKYEFSSQSSILFAHFLDNIHINQLSNYVNELSILLLGGRLNLQYNAELNLLSSFLYYFSSLTCMHKTLGQSFCDFSLIKVSNNYDSLNNQSKRIIVRKLTLADRLVLSVLYSLFPYILKRKLSIYKQVLLLYNILKTDCSEEHHDTTTIHEQTNTNIEQQQQSQSQEIAELHPKQEINDFIISKLRRALIASISVLGSDDENKINNLEHIIQDIHRFWFLLNGQYFEFALRILKIRHITTSSPKFNISLKPLAWMLGLRMSLLFYYATRIVLSEIDKELKPRVVTTATTTDNETNVHSHNYSKTSDDHTHIDTVDSINSISMNNNNNHNNISNHSNNTNISNINVMNNSNSISFQCSLCIDKIVAPTVIPCGHIFCWRCILDYINRIIGRTASTTTDYEREYDFIHYNDDNNNTNTTNNNDNSDISARNVMRNRGDQTCKCPMCRYEFRLQNIRLLHNY